MFIKVVKYVAEPAIRDNLLNTRKYLEQVTNKQILQDLRLARLDDDVSKFPSTRLRGCELIE